MSKIFPEDFILNLTWDETFKVAKECWNNAQRLHHSALLLSENDFVEQAYNNLFIACEEYYKAKTFEGISYIKMQGNPLNDGNLKTFINKAGNHQWKFREVFSDAQYNIPNISIKTSGSFDDSEIQENLHKDMENTFKLLDQLNPYDKKNNSLYVGYNSNTKSLSVPKLLITKDLVQKLSEITFYVQMTCNVDEDAKEPSGDVGFYLKWCKLDSI